MPHLSDPELISTAIAASGLSARRFAVEVMGVDERSVRRWQAGASPIRNREDREWLEAWVALYASRPAFRRAVG